MFDQPHRLHPAAIIIRFGQVFVALVRSSAIPIIAVLFSGSHKSADDIALKVALIAGALGVISLLAPIVQFFTTTFYIKDGALEIQSGLIYKKKSTIPLARIQNVNIERTIWHRFLGAAAIKVETATGHKGEGSLAALSLDAANKLQAVLLRHAHLEPEKADEPAKVEPLYELSLKQILLAGALGNRVMYIIAGMFTAFQADGVRHFINPISRYIGKLDPVVAFAMSIASFIVLFIVGWIVSIVISATRYYGFRIERHEKGLLLSHGMFTQFRKVLPLGRIQDVRIVQPMLYRMFGYCEMYADTAGAFDHKDTAGANKVCPIVPEHDASSIGKLLIPEFEFERLQWFSVSSRTVIRKTLRYTIVASIMLATPLGLWLHWNAFWALIPIAILSFVAAVIAFQYTGYSWTGDLLASRGGVLRKHTTLIPFDRCLLYTSPSPRD